MLWGWVSSWQCIGLMLGWAGDQLGGTKDLWTSMRLQRRCLDWQAVLAMRSHIVRQCKPDPHAILRVSPEGS